MPSARIVVIDSLAWAALSAAIGGAASWSPSRWFDRDHALTAVRSWEYRGRWYRRVLRIDRWKDRLPEVNGFGRGGRTTKSALSGRAMVDDLLRETRRAEYVHVAIATSGVLFILWNPWWLALVMIVAGIAWNAPFVAVQRYNRARLLSLPSQRRRRQAAAERAGLGPVHRP